MARVLHATVSNALHGLRSSPPWLKSMLRPLKNPVYRVLRFDPRRSAVVDSDDYWGSRHSSEQYWSGGLHWGDLPDVQEYQWRRISGDPKVGPFDYAAKKFIAPLRKNHKKIRALSLCCGSGRIEVDFLKRGIVDYIEGYDASEGSINEARAAATEAGVSDRCHFETVDLNSFSPESSEKFQVVYNEAALHHIENLEHVFKTLQGVLTEDGIIINHDYIGPNQHQWTETQLRLINKIYSFLPPELRASRTAPGLIHKKREAHSIAEMNRIDPTEGIRAAEIISTMEKYFDIVERNDFGGTILHLLFNDIAGNFSKNECRPLVKTLVCLEEELIDSGALSSDFSFFVARNR